MGFPIRPSRAAIGPTKNNKLGVIGDPTLHLNADEINLFEWQVAGLGIMSPLVWAVLLTDAATPTVVDGGYAWDPNRELALPTVVRDSAGLFTLTFPSTGLDETGVARDVVLKYGIAHAQTSSRRASAEVLSNNTIQIGCRLEATGALNDGPAYIILLGY